MGKFLEKALDLLKELLFRPVYSGVLCLCLVGMIFMPEHVARIFGIDKLRHEHLAYFSIPMFVAGALFVAGTVEVLSAKGKEKRQARKDKTNNDATKITVLKRIESLSDDEKWWLIYCLSKNQQTLSAYESHPTAAGLCHKGLLEEAPGGTLLAVPFTFPDFVWDYLQANKSTYLSSLSKSDLRALENFPQTLRRAY